MPDITYAEWISDTAKFGKFRSSALKAVDQAFQTYESNTNKVTLENLSKAFKTWKDTKMVQVGIIATVDTMRNRKKDGKGNGPVDRLQQLITGAKVSNVAIKMDATGLDERTAVEDVFTTSEGARITEALRRLEAAAQDARDAIIKAKTATSPERARYVTWFGAFSDDRYATVKSNFMKLDKVCAKGGLIFKDGRNDPVLGAAFAWTYRGNKDTFVNVWLGTSFFIKGSYAVSSDATVVTLIHELAHAIFMASDVPTVASGQVLDANGMPPNGAPVCNDAANDKTLATQFPDRALLNADNYGQFAWETIKTTGK